MKQIPPEMAKALISLLEVIDSNNDKYPDWIDAVCSAREKLPESTFEALKSLVDTKSAPTTRKA